MSARQRTATAIRFDPDVYDRLVEAGDDHGRSVNWLVNEACRYYLHRLLPADQVRLLRDEPGTP